MSYKTRPRWYLWEVVRKARRTNNPAADLWAAAYLVGVDVDKDLTRGGDVYLMRYEPKSGRSSKSAARFVGLVWGTGPGRDPVRVRGRAAAFEHALRRWSGLSRVTRMQYLRGTMG